MEKRKEPDYAPGQELTLHPVDDVRGAELLRKNLRKAQGEKDERPPADQKEIRF